MRKHVLVSAVASTLAAVAGHPAHAIHPNQLIGDWQSQNNTTCLYAPGGFNAHLQQNNPPESYVNQHTSFGIQTFAAPASISPSGAITGNLTRNYYVLSTSFPASAGNTTFVPSSSKTVFNHDVQTYHMQTGSNAVSVTVQNELGSILSGPRAGQTNTVDGYTVAGYASADNKTIYWESPDDTIENVTWSGGGLAAPQTVPRICHRATTLTKTQ
jgi:hypothetical protein